MSRAFTFVEVLITVALFVILIIGIAQLYLVYGKVVTFQESSIGVALDGDSIVSAVGVAGSQASHVISSHVFFGTSYTSGTTTAIFELPSVDSSGGILDTYDYVGIYASSTSVYRTIDAAGGSVRISGQKRLTDSLDALSFTYDNISFPLVTSVTVDATTSVVVRGQTTYMHARGHVYLRNL